MATDDTVASLMDISGNADRGAGDAEDEEVGGTSDGPIVADGVLETTTMKLLCTGQPLCIPLTQVKKTIL